MFGKVSDYVLTINVLTVIINFSVVDHGRTWTKTGDFLNMKICGETFHICLRSCVSWAVFGHHSDETKETEPDIWMCFMQNTVCLSFCICTTNVAVCSKTIPFNVLTTNRPSFRKKNSPEMLFFFFLLLLRLWPASQKQTIKIQYLISHLLFAALMDVSWSFGREPQLLPSGGPSFQSPLTGIRSSCREDRGRSQAKWGRTSRNESPGSDVFKVETDAQVSTEEK